MEWEEKKKKKGCREAAGEQARAWVNFLTLHLVHLLAFPAVAITLGDHPSPPRGAAHLVGGGSPKSR